MKKEESVAIKVEAEIGSQTLSFEAGKLAEQADGAVLVRFGDTVVLATAVASEPREGIDFFPLTVDYEERMYAAGKIPGGFIKRESRPSEAAILAMRLTDRPIRPLFPKGYKQEVQIVLTVLSADQENDPDILAVNGASAALSVSGIPFLGPVGAVRVGRINGEFVANPTTSQLDESELDLVVAGTRDAIMMVEAGAKILPEAVMLDAITWGHAELQKSIDLQEKLVASAGTPKKLPFVAPKADSVVKLGKLLAEGRTEFVVFDVETTSMKPENGYIVDLAALRVRDGQVVDRFESLVNPGRPIVGHQVHGISTEHAHTNGRPLAEVVDELRTMLEMEWAAGVPVLGHNVAYDLTVLACECERFNMRRFTIAGPVIDSIVLDRAVEPYRRGKRNLTTPCQVYGITLSEADAHTSDADALASARLAWKIAKRYPEQVGNLALDELMEWQRLAHREDTDRDDHDVDAVGELERARGEPGLGGRQVEADEPDRQPQEQADEAAQLGGAEHAADQHHRQQHDREVRRRADLHGLLRDGRGEEGDQQGADRAGDERLGFLVPMRLA